MAARTPGKPRSPKTPAVTGTPSILVAHGVNLDLLGTREPGIYGALNLQQLNERISRDGAELARLAGFAGVRLEFFQSNDEAAFLAALKTGYDGFLLNPGAWTHTSLALADRLRALGIPFAEVHLSNVYAREQFRHHSFAAPHAAGVVCGFGAASYLAGLLGLLCRIR